MGSRYTNVAGVIFGRLTALEFAGSTNGHTYWTCKCSCGKLVRVRLDGMKAGRQVSCGCRLSDPGKGQAAMAKVSPEERLKGPRNSWRTRKQNGVPMPVERARGEAAGSARLTEDQAREIRSLFGASGIIPVGTGADYGVCDRTVYSVARGETWKHL